LLALAIGPPVPRQGGRTIEGAVKAERQEIGMRLLQCLPLLA